MKIIINHVLLFRGRCAGSDINNVVILCARYLLLDDQTIRNYEKRYQSSGVEGLLSDNYVGCASRLTAEREEQLKEHLRENT